MFSLVLLLVGVIVVVCFYLRSRCVFLDKKNDVGEEWGGIVFFIKIGKYL